MQPKVHPTENQLQDLSFGRLSTADSIRLQRHLFMCPPCLKRLIEIETVMAFAEKVLDFSPVPDRNKPLFVVHHTGDGMIYLKAEKRGKKWVARRWGRKLQGGGEYGTMQEANDSLVESFRQMFPEHRCTKKCQLHPKQVIHPLPR